MWGAWAIGMAASPGLLKRLEQNGMGIIQPSVGLGAFAKVLALKHYMAEVSLCLIATIKSVHTCAQHGASIVKISRKDLSRKIEQTENL